MSKITIPSLIVAGLLSTAANAQITGSSNGKNMACQFPTMPGISILCATNDTIYMGDPRDQDHFWYTHNGEKYQIFYFKEEIIQKIEYFYTTTDCNKSNSKAIAYIPVGYPGLSDSPVWGDFDGQYLIGPDMTKLSTFTTHSFLPLAERQPCVTEDVNWSFAPSMVIGDIIQLGWKPPYHVK